MNHTGRLTTIEAARSDQTNYDDRVSPIDELYNSARVSVFATRLP